MYGVSIELERRRPLCSSMTMALAKVSPKPGRQDLEGPIKLAVASGEGCGTDNVLNHLLGPV